MELFADRWAFGSGAGTFFAAFPYYRPPEFSQIFYRFAHNDWLQFLAEFGVAGTAIAAWFAWAVARTASRPLLPAVGALRIPRDRLEGKLRRGCILALSGICVHATVDFPFHTPALALHAAALLGILYALLSVRSERHALKEHGRRALDTSSDVAENSAS